MMYKKATKIYQKTDQLSTCNSLSLLHTYAYGQLHTYFSLSIEEEKCYMPLFLLQGENKKKNTKIQAKTKLKKYRTH